MQNILIGDTRINGNLEVEGTQTILNTETLIIQDGIIGVNSPAVVGRDSGLLIECAPDFTGTATIINSTSAVIEQIAEPGWILKIGSETREILTVVSTTVTYAATIIFVNGPYQLFKNLSAGFFYKPSTEKFYAGYTQNISSDNILNITPGTLVVNRLEQLFGEQVWYVGKHGHDSLSGRTIAEARLTFMSIPGGSTIVCLDEGIYNETVPVSGAIFAPNAQINYLQINGGQVSIKNFINAQINGGILKFVSGSTVDVTGGQNKIYGEKLTGLIGINCTAGELNGHITEFDCLTSIITNGTVTLMSEISRSPTLASGTGTLYFLCSKIDSFVTSGSGTFYAIDAKMASDHFLNTNNPHNVTFAQISTMTQRGDLLTHNGTNNIVLPRGTAGQILSVQGDLNLGWTAPANSLKSFMIHPETTLVSSNTFVTIAYFTWKHSEFSGFGLGKLIFNVVSTINVKFTNGLTNFINGTFTAGYHAASMISNPTADTVIFLQVQKNITGGQIIGVSLLF